MTRIIFSHHRNIHLVDYFSYTSTISSQCLYPYQQPDSAKDKIARNKKAQGMAPITVSVPVQVDAHHVTVTIKMTRNIIPKAIAKPAPSPPESERYSNIKTQYI